MLVEQCTPLRRSAVAELGAALLAAAALSSTWNAVQVRGVSPSDGLLLLGLGVLVLHIMTRRSHIALPPLVAVGAALIAVAGLWSWASPVADAYESIRFVPTNELGLREDQGPGGGPQLAKFLVGLVLIPVALQIVDRSSGRMHVVVATWVGSSVISCLVAVSDELGTTSVSTGLRGAIDVTGRQAGLTAQPNHLAVAAVLALPFALLWALRGRGPARGLAAAAVPVLLGGVLVSGSRGGGAACVAVLGIVVVHLARHDARQLLVAVAATVLCLSFTWQQAVSTLIGTKFTGEAAQRSNAERAALLSQAWQDFVHSPVHGIGFQHINAAHQVQLQLLSAGGLLALTGFLVYVTGVLAGLRAAARSDGVLAAAAAASVAAWLLLGLVENQLIDRYLYFPPAVLIALAARTTHDGPVVARGRADRRPVVPGRV